MAIDNLKILQQMIALQAQVVAGQREIIEMLGKQATAAKQATDSTAGSLEKIDKLVDKIQTSGDKARKSLGDQSAAFTGLSEEIATAANESTDASGALSKFWKAAIGGSLLAGAKAGFKTLVGQLSAMTDIAYSLIDTFGQVAKSIFAISEAMFSIPFRMFSGLIQMSNALAQEYKHIAESFEKFRASFGDLNNEIGKSLKGALAGAKQMGKLGGLGYYSVFTDSAEAVHFFQEQFEGLGPLIDTFGKEIRDMGGKFIYFVKGMGLSATQTKELGTLAKATGRTMESVFSEMNNMTMQLADTFGLSNKQIARDVTDMTADVATFGNASVKSLASTAVRIRSLGLEVKSLKGVVDKYLNFEDAAKNSSMLSQAFGVNLDALSLMNSAGKDQGKLVDQLRNSFFAAGRDATKMTTAELRLLAANTGLNEEEARLAFSMRNRGKSLDQIKRQAAGAEKKELSQAEAMSKLADAIERVIRVFDYDSFFGAFFDGFSLGVQHTGEFTGLLFDLHAALDQIRIAGQKVGAAFIKIFPGIADMISGFRDVFNPKVFKKIGEQLTETFNELFSDLGKDIDPRFVMHTLWTKLQFIFSSLLGDHGDAVSLFAGGFKSFMGALRKIFVGSMPMIKDSVVNALRGITDGIRWFLDPNPGGSLGKALNDTLGPGGSEIVDILWDGFFKPIYVSLLTAWRSPEMQNAIWGDNGLVVALKDLLWEGVMYIGDWMYNNPGMTLAIVGGLVALIAGPAVISGLLAGISALVGVIGGAIGSLVIGAIGLLAAPEMLIAGAVLIGGAIQAMIFAAMVAIPAVISAALGAAFGYAMYTLFNDPPDLTKTGVQGLGKRFGLWLKGPFLDAIREIPGIIVDTLVTGVELAVAGMLTSLGMFADYIPALAMMMFEFLGTAASRWIDFAAGVWDGLLGEGNSISAAFRGVSGFIDGIVDAVTRLRKWWTESFSDMAKTVSDKLGPLGPVIEKMFGGESETASPTTSAAETAARARAEAIIRSSKDMSTRISTMAANAQAVQNDVKGQTADLQVNTDKVVKGVVGANKKFFDVDSKGNGNVNVNVTIDAGKLAKILIATGKVMPKER